MTLVRILRDFSDLGLLRQTPGGQGLWDGLRFTEQAVESSDYVLVLNKPAADTRLRCSPERVWAIMQEPPNEVFGWLHRGDPSYARIYTTDERLPSGGRYIHAQPALAWHVNRDYDFLSRCGAPEKARTLSWVTSNKAVFRGHRARLRFMQALEKQVGAETSFAFDLFGIGYRYIEDKWDALAPYRYSLAIENYANAWYWSEKLTDCFLAWCMPVYYGCTRITDYFPSEALLIIDLQDPDCSGQIRAAIENKLWQRNLEAIAYARKLTLERYQLFPFIAQEIRAYEAGCVALPAQMQEIMIPAVPRVPLGYRDHLRRFWRRITPHRLRACLGRARQFFE